MESASADASSRSWVTYTVVSLQAALKSREFLPQCRPQFGVEARQRLVEEQDPRLANESTRQGDALLLAAGQFVWVTIDQLLNPDDP